MKGYAASVHGEHEHEAAVATLWAGRDVGLRRAQSSRLAKSGRLVAKEAPEGKILAGK
jgi:hypothetical protein